MKTNRIKIEGIVFLAIASLLTTFSVASAQDERVLNLAYSTLTQEERELYLKTPEEQKEEYVRSVRELAAGLFATLGKETEPREYSAEEKPYVGESGTLTPEQVAAVKTFVDPRLENPPRALTDDEKKSVAQAFDLSDFDFRLRELAFESAAADFLGAAATSVTSCELFDVNLSDNIYRATYDELQPQLAAVLENHSVQEILEKLQGRPILVRTLVEGALLERLADRFNDAEYARVLNEYVWTLCLAGSLDGHYAAPTEPERQTAPVIIEELINKALEARPNSWEVAYVYASTVWNYLPKTFKPSDDPDGAPTRIAYDADRIPEGTLSAEDRDRVLVLRTLTNALPFAIDAATTGEPSTFQRRVISTNAYFALLSDALALKSLRGRNVNMNNKTDLDSSPEMTIAVDPRNARVGQIVQSNPGRNFQLPPSFADAANDGERFVLAQTLARAGAGGASNEGNHALFLGSLAALVRKEYGVQNNLTLASQLRRALTQNSYASRPEQRELVQQEIARLDAFIAEIPNLQDNEAFTKVQLKTQGLPLENSQSFQPKRVVLGKECDFVALLKRSIELEESFEALAVLAQEMQLRGKYDQALELWNRAKNAPSFVKRDAPLPPIASDLKNVERNSVVNGAIRKIESVGSISIDGKNGGATGMTVSFDVVSRNVRELKTTFYQLDLAPYIAQTLEPTFITNFGDFGNLISERIADAIRNYRLANIATEVQSETRPVAVDESRRASSTRTPLTFTLEKPGVYVLQVADANRPVNATYALAFVSRYSFAYQFNRKLFVSDVQTGEPYADREIDLLETGFPGMPSSGGANAKTETVKTDDVGSFSPSNMDVRLAFVQDGTPEEYDRSVSVFEYVNNPYVLADVFDATPKRHNEPILILATDRPIYEPGDTVEYVAQIVMPPKQHFIPTDFSYVRVFAKTNPGSAESPRALVAEFDAEFDESQSLAGSFKIPEDAESGEYAFSVCVKLREMTTGQVAYLPKANSPIFVAKRGAAPTPTGKTPDPSQPTAAASAPQPSTPAEPMIEVEFDKPRYSLSDEAANVVVRSPKSDAVVSVYKYRPSINGSAPSFSTPEIVRLTDGVGQCRIPLEAADAPFVTLVANFAGDNKAQAAYYLVGVGGGETNRGVALETPDRVKAGEKTKIVAKIAPGEAPFVGRASLAVYDVNLSVAPVDDFARYFAVSTFGSRLLLRQTLPPKPLLNPAFGMNAPAPTREPEGYVQARTIYDDFLASETPLPQTRPSALRSRAVRTNGNNNSPSPFVLDAVPGVPTVASSDSILKSTVMKLEGNDGTATFEFDAPKTPGTYRAVFRAFDPEKGCAAFVQKDFIVE